jgi:hypothetical protein
MPKHSRLSLSEPVGAAFPSTPLKRHTPDNDGVPHPPRGSRTPEAVPGRNLGTYRFWFRYQSNDPVHGADAVAVIVIRSPETLVGVVRTQ